MSWLVLSIVFSTLVVLLFKYFERYNVNTFNSIIVNYAVCFTVGIVLSKHPSVSEVIRAPWFSRALVLGILFITVFNAIGWVAQKISVSVSMVAAKMSVVIPVLFAVFYLGEQLQIIKIAGIVCSLVALYFVVGQKQDQTKKTGVVLLYPLLVFAGSGAIDTLMKYIQVTYFHQSTAESVLIVVFGMAFLSGIIWYGFSREKRNKGFTHRDLLGGIILGVPNYFSMYFLFRALNEPSLGATVVFPVNNIGIVLLSTLLAIALFKEHLTHKGIAGIVLAVISIFIIARF
ncbi:MAG: EamA family transporter [Bacteroidia bacterium]|nr:EamA family transporter [Bacteroidia bacterium]